MEKPTSISVSVKDVLANLKWDHKAGTVYSGEIVKSVAKSPAYVNLVHSFNLLKIKHKEIALDQLLSNSLIETIELNAEDMQIPHLLLGMLKTLGSKKYSKFKKHIKDLHHKKVKKVPANKFEGVVQDLTASYRARKLKDVVARSALEKELITTICSKYKSSVLLIGPKGSGKTSAIISLAKRIINGDVPTMLAGSRVISVNLNKIMSNSSISSYSAFDIISLLSKYSHNSTGYTIFFFDDIHLLNTYGVLGFTPPIADEFFNIITDKNNSVYDNAYTKGSSSFNQLDSSTDKNVALSFNNNKVVFIAALNEDYADRFLDSPLQESWSTIYIKDPIKSELKNILLSKLPMLEAHYNVEIDSKVIPLVCKSVNLSDNSEGELIGEGLKILDSLVSNYVLSHISSPIEFKSYTKSVNSGLNIRHAASSPKVSRNYAVKFLKQYHNVPLNTKSSIYGVKTLNDIHGKLSNEIIGQQEAINSLVSVVKRSYLGIKDPKKPMCSLLFLGPTGVGKSQTAKSLATCLYSNKHLLRIDMADFAEKHTVARLVGSPPGYVGYGEGGQLTDFIKEYPKSVILFDEIEKAHSDVLNILLSILQEGEVTSGDGEVLKFNESIIILTSNLGAELLSKSQIGFNSDTFDVKNKKAQDLLLANLKKKIRPEILNRLDDIVVFNSLKKSHAKTIVDKNLNYYNKLILKKHKTTLKYDKDIIRHLTNLGYSVEYGARELNRSIEKNLLTPVVDKIIKHHPKVKKEYRVSIKKGKLIVR